MQCRINRGAAKSGGKLKLLPVLLSKVRRRAANEIKKRCLPLTYRLIKYPNVDSFLFADQRACSYYFHPNQRDELIGVWRSVFDCEADVIDAANKVTDHIFDLLGSGPLLLDDDINWHEDFKSRAVWPSNKPLSGRDIVNLGNCADIKVPWELSRFQHVSLMGKAWWLTGDDRYASEYINQILDWIDKNPWGCGPNWACTMDVAIRAANWILGYHFFESCPMFDERWRRKIVRSLWEHGWFIERNLEQVSITSNHYISDLAGLFAIGVFFSSDEQGKRWRDFALDELFSEMRRQVLEDGVDYEKSTGYQRLVLELFTYTFILAEMNGLNIPADVRERWEKMFDFVAAYIKPDGLAPQIGDADDGMYYKLSLPAGQYPFLDHRYLLSLGALIFNRPDFAGLAGGYSEEAFWASGANLSSSFKNMIGNDKPESGCKAFKTAGLYIMRADRQYVIIDAGDNGMEGLGSHAHNDTLSFELYAFDKTFIVDPGTYLYSADPQARNSFRSTAYHNTVMVDGEEIHPVIAKWLFALPDAGSVRATRWETDGDELIFEAEHDAYRRLSEPVTHRRLIRFDKSKAVWEVEDSFEGTGNHRFDLWLHFAPGIDLLQVREANGCFETVCEGARLKIEPRIDSKFEAAVEDGWYSPSYGCRIPDKVLRYSWNAAAPCKFTVLLSAVK